MSTNASIAVAHGNIIKAVYLHWDGGLDHVGKILAAHYPSSKANQLVALGNISSLGSSLGEKHDFDNPPNNTCNFYGRDRDEDDHEWSTFNSEAEWLAKEKDYGREYMYLMKNDVWYVSIGGEELQVLTYALLEPVDK